MEKEEEKRINFEYEFEDDFEEKIQKKKDFMRKSCNCETKCYFHHESFTETCILGEGEEKKEIYIFVRKIENKFSFKIKTIISEKFTDKIISKNEELYSIYISMCNGEIYTVYDDSQVIMINNHNKDYYTKLINSGAYLILYSRL